MQAQRMIVMLAALLVGNAAIADDINNNDSEQASIDKAGIAAQPLDSALEEFAERSGLQVIYLADVARGKRSPGAEADLSDQAMLDQLLASTNVQYEFLNDNTVTLQAIPDDQGGDSNSKNLSPMPVLVAQNQAKRTQTGVSKERSKSLETAESQNGKPAEQLEEIVVTGTNIRGVENLTVPVLQFDREDIDLSGAATIDDFVRTIPQNFASHTQLSAESGNPNDRDNLTQGTTVDLRGLGAGSTLTLLNGRRMTPSGQSSLVDINVLPLGVIDRMEVLTDGATAIYGSDAVGGVINFVTRKDYEGLDISARYGSVTDGSKEDWGIGGAGGFNWGSGGMFAGADYQEVKPLLLEERDFIDASLANEGTVIGSDTRRTSVAGGANQDFGSSARLAVDALYSDFSAESGFIAGAVPITNGSDQEALYINSRFEYDITDDITTSVFFDYGRNETVSTFGFLFFGSVLEDSGQYENTMNVLEGRISGKAFDLPGGEVSFSLGGLYREEDYTEAVNGVSTIEAARDVIAAYAEVLVPIVGDQNTSAFMQRLQLSLAGRYEDYSSVGDTFDPKVGLYVEFNDQLSLRASYTESFRAPDLRQSSGRRGFSINAFPLDNITAFTPPAPSPLVPLISSFDEGVLYVRPFALNPDLRTESAVSWSAGFVFEPKGPDGLRLEGNFFDIQYTDRIERIRTTQPFQDPSLSVLVNLSPSLAEVQSIFDRAEAGDIILVIPDDLEGIVTPEDIQLIVRSGTQNVSERSVRGFDLNINYGIDTDLGRLSAGMNATYLTDYIGRLAPESPSAEQLNVLYRPIDLKLRGNVTWSRNGFTVFAAVNHTDSYRDNIDTTIAEPIDSWTTIDLSLVYNTEDRFDHFLTNDVRLGFSVTNLFDEAPPFVNTPFGLNFDTVNADPLGRQVNFRISKLFQ